MSVTLISLNRFHHFHLARQLERLGLLETIWTGYPRYKLRDEPGIPPAKIRSYPWLQTPYLAALHYGLARLEPIRREWMWQALESLDRQVAKHLLPAATVVAIAGSGLHAGQKAQALGGRYVCDLPTSHIRHRDRMLREEYQRWGLKHPGVDPRELAKQEAEFDRADAITIASEYSRRTCLAEGVPERKLKKITYGARLERFQKRGDPDQEQFQVLWVGQVSLSKGFLYLLEAFQKFRHPHKRLVVVGAVLDDLRRLLVGQNLENVRFTGAIPNPELVKYYSESHVFVFPSIDDGFGMVLGEALACGCPVIASTHTGAEDFIRSGTEGFIVPIRSADAILEKLEWLAQDPDLRETMSEAALKCVGHLGGWDAYGDAYAAFLKELGQSKGATDQ